MAPRLIVAKLAALLHDPPWKPWVVSAGFQGVVGGRGISVGRLLAREPGEGDPFGRYVEGCKGLVEDVASPPSAHEADAIAAARHILGPLGLAGDAEELIRNRNSVVGEADRLASSLDRWLIYGQGRARVRARPRWFLNILEPRFKIPVRPTLGAREAARICNYVAELADIVGKAKNANLPLPLIYNLLYLLLEPLWYKHVASVCPDCIPLADTRVPNHTVFDHLAATASMVNWAYGAHGRPQGLLVKIDLAGIQEFISAARKTRDLWAGSWMASALTWYVVSESVLLLGADVVLSPYTGANHFFIASLLRKLHDMNAEGLAKLVEDVARDAYLWKGVANQPLAPATLFLALPCLDEGDEKELREAAEKLGLKGAKDLLEALVSCDPERLRRYFTERFRAAWRSLAEAVIEAYSDGSVDDFVSRISSALEAPERAAREYLEGVLDTPPRLLRVVVVSVGEEYSRLLNMLKDKAERLRSVVDELGRLGLGQDEVAKRILYAWLFGYALPREEKAYRLVGVEPGYWIADVLNRYTGEGSVVGKGYRECTVCAGLPALIHVSDDNIDALAEQLGVPRSLFTPGESLCPYCLVKRLTTLDKALVNVMRGLGLYTGRTTGVYPRVPSTAELASLDQLLSLAEKLVADAGLRRRLLEALRIGEERRLAPSEPLERLVDSLPAPDEARDEAKRILGVLEARYDFSQVLASGALASPERCSEELSEELCGALREALGAEASGARYYVIVRGDGDFFGKRVVRGKLALRTSEYLREMREAVLEGVEEGLREDAEKQLTNMHGIVERVVEVVELLLGDEGYTVPASPSYYAALSRGQMITALIDAEIVWSLGGFPVYAGGDDVAALMPGWLSREHAERLVDAWWRSTGARLGLHRHPVWRSVFPAAAAVALTRLDYWGILSPVGPGFHRTPVGAIYAAPAAYGRSYGVLVAHYRDPFSAAWNTAGTLEELKDRITAQSIAGEAAERDTVFLAYGRITGLQAYYTPPVVVLPNIEPGIDRIRAAEASRGEAGGAAAAHRVAGTVVDAIRVAESVVEESLSRSIYSDFERECSLAERTVSSNIVGAVELSASLVHHLVARNAARQDTGVEELAEQLSRYTSTVARGPGDLVACEAPLAWHIVLAAKAIDSGRR